MNKTLQEMTTGYVIAFTLASGRRYWLADRPEWDGAWYTDDLGNARRYKTVRGAERTIKSYGWPATYSAAVESL